MYMYIETRPSVKLLEILKSISLRVISSHVMNSRNMYYMSYDRDTTSFLNDITLNQKDYQCNKRTREKRRKRST